MLLYTYSEFTIDVSTVLVYTQNKLLIQLYLTYYHI